jgi:(S)-ureidoglycine aminohydrolase
VHNLGHTRSCKRRNFSLITPDTFVRTTLPGMQGCTAVVHVSPASGAQFTQYTAEFELGGELGGVDAQRFMYLLEGSLQLEIAGKESELGAKGYAYVPQGLQHKISSTGVSRAVVIEKTYEPLPAIDPPNLLISSEEKVSSQALGDEGLQVKCLLPDELPFDFAVNSMVYQPGAALSMVEMHIMEHGMLMLEGGGIYRLDDEWHPVTAGDFVWMAPWCPQWFGAIGKTPAKYLIYKDWNRHPVGGQWHETRNR